MDVAITGASGLIGRALSASLEADGHRVLRVVRSEGGTDTVRWDPMTATIDASGLEGIDAVVHLAGEPIASGPWTTRQQHRIHNSREQGTRLIATTIAGLANPPATLVSGSAIGYYGNRGDERLDEASAPGTDFLARVCLDWEAAASAAATDRTRVVCIRTGIVLDAHGGALGKQLPLFKLGLGGKAGRGTQWMSWITLADEVRAIRFALDDGALEGPVNLTAPNPVTNAEFTKALGAAVRRPTIVPVPRLVRHLPLGIGDLLDSLLFSSARVEPDALVAAGFTFEHAELAAGLDAVLGRA